jgi:Uma2 family endonuclease
MAIMASSTPTAKLTYDDYCNAPEDKRYELLDGDLVVVPAPKEAHQRVLINLSYLVLQSVKRSGVGHVYAAPFDVVLSENDVVQPDLLFISNERAHIITAENVQGAPDLVVEILSPSTADRDLFIKRSLYAKHGVQEYWLVDTDAKTVTVLLRGPQGFAEVGVCGEGQTLESLTLKGFTINPEEIF